LAPEPPRARQARPPREERPGPGPTRLDLPTPADRERERPASKRPQPAPVPVTPLADPPREARDDRARPADPLGRPGLGSRLAAGLADLVVPAAIGAIALMGARLLGAEPTLAEWPALALFLLSFSFLYTILPLAFWGQTLGMTWVGLLSRNRDGEPLTFDQTARRWLGGLLTTATLGLPLLLAGPAPALA